MGRQLQLNFTPLRVRGDAIRLQALPFEDAQQFRNLRDEHRAHYAVTRRSDHIVALPLTLNASPIGEEKIVSVVEHASLIRPLLEQRLVTLLSSNRRPVARYNPITTIGRTLPTGFIEADRHLHLQSRVLIAIRSLKLPDAEPLGLLWDIEIQKTCATSLAVLHAQGVRLDGLTVERLVPVEDVRMLPYRRLVGRVGALTDGHARLSERFQNVEELLPLDELYLEASPENLRHLLQHFMRNTSGRVQGKIDEIVFENSRGRARMEHIARISDWLRGLGEIELQEGLSVGIGNLLSEKDAQNFPRFTEGTTPTYVFDAGTLKSESRAAVGLS